jgi:hypothetical protein
MPHRGPTLEQIVSLVEAFEKTYQPVHDRMDKDYDLWNLKPYVPETDQDVGYREYTSNDPRTNANKAITLMSTAKIITKVPEGKKDRENREKHNDKERTGIGFMNSAEERLKRMVDSGATGLQFSFSWQATVRGYITARYLLFKREVEGGEDETFVDITPWDPKAVSWGMGRDGLAWVCHKTTKTLRQIEEEYGKKKANAVRAEMAATTPEEQDQEPITIYDFYNRIINKVTTDRTLLKKDTEHGAKWRGMPAVPALVVPVPTAPRVSTGETNGNLVDVGDSIYASNRDLYPKANLIKSIYLELVARARKPVLLITSPDGSKTLDADPFKSGTSISKTQGDNVEVMDFLKATDDAANLLGLTLAEQQRGIFPNTAFGELQFQLSGFAINTLGQSLSTVIQPFLSAMTTAYEQILNGLLDHYASGEFEAMELSGEDNNREWFIDTIEPDTIKDLPAIQVRLVALLPRDDAAKVAMAQQLTDGDDPLFDHRTVLEDVLDVQDPDQIQERIQHQMAEKSSPVAAAVEFMLAAARQGDFLQAQIWQRQAEFEVLKLELELARLQMVAAGLANPEQGPGGGGANGASPNGQPRFDPRVAPNAVIGVQPPQPVGQAGVLVPPGSPRPGARRVPL